MDKPAYVVASELHETNRRYWDAAAPGWERLRDEDGGWRECARQPQLGFEGRALETLIEVTGSLKGKRVCLVGSGDNYAAFALAGMGAEVTSVDISGQQLEIAASRASQLGLEIQFVRADAADLQVLDAGSFDLVCSTNGFFVWLADLATVFGEIARCLKTGGHYVFYDVHPFQRPWKARLSPIEMTKHYWDRQPDDAGDDNSAHEFHWPLAEIFNALAAAGLSVCKVVESPAGNSRFWQGYSYQPGTNDDLLDWRHNPRAGLPVWLAVSARKLDG